MKIRNSYYSTISSFSYQFIHLFLFYLEIYIKFNFFYIFDYHFTELFEYLTFGGTGELVALLETLGCSGTVNLVSVDFHTGGLIFFSQCSVCVVLFNACIGILYNLIGRKSGDESETVSYYLFKYLYEFFFY